MSAFNRHFKHTPVFIALSLALSSPIMAADFTILDGVTETIPKTLNDNEMGNIQTGGRLLTNVTAIDASGISNSLVNDGDLTTSGNNSRGVVTSGDLAIITNNGDINTVGTSSDAVYSSGANAVISNGGGIDTQGDGANGVLSIGAGLTITNSGTINTAGQTASGIFSIGVEAHITNSGDITSNRSFGISASGSDSNIVNTGNITSAATGVRASGDNANITNTGSISTIGNDARGIEAGDRTTISNSGTITTLGARAWAIYAKRDATISNSGTITSHGDDAYGIYTDGEGNIITNNGSISTVGERAHGLYAESADSILINSGSVTTSGLNAHGIYAEDDDSTITNSGSILTNGVDAYGIFSKGENTTIINSGNISTTGETEGFGIYSTGEGAIITNSGSISTIGIVSGGIYSTGNTDVINNSGSISTGGERAHGIWSSAMITNSGSIVTTGVGADGLRSTGADATTINNSGLISATGTDSFAVLGFNNKITLNLLPSSQIIGRIDLGNDGRDNDTANVYVGGVSANLTFENTENINLFGTGVVSGDTVITVDATGESTRGVALASMTSSIHNVIGQRMAQTTPLEPVQVAALTLSPGMYFEEHKPVAWAQVFGGTFDRDAEGSALAYDHDHVGINFGYEWDVNQNRIGLMGGVVSTETQTQVSSFSSDANNYYIGAYGNRKVNGFNITGSLLAGYGDHDNDRLVVDNINGFEVARSDFDSFFISPSVTIASAYKLDDRLEIRPSANIAYSMAWLDDYTETGTTNSNLTIDERKAKALTAKVQLAAAYALSQSSEFEFRVGMNSRHTDDEDTNVSIAGSQFKFANAGDENVSGGFAGANLRVVDDNNLTLVADIEFGGNSDEDYAAGHIGLEYVF